MMMRILLTTLALFIGCFIGTTHAQTDEFNLNQAYSIDPGGTISLESDDAEVQITGSDRDDVRVIVHYELTVNGFTFGSESSFEMIVEENNGNLKIYEKPRDFGSRGLIGFSREEYTIEIVSPRDVNLDITGDDEEYEIAGIDGTFRLEADDSDIRITDCNGNEFSFDIDDGNLTMDCGTGNLRLNLDDGDARINNGSFSNIDAEMDDSNIEITTSLADDGDYRFDMDDADLTLNIVGGGGEFDIRHEDSDVSSNRVFEMITEDDDRSMYRLPGGNARIYIKSDDGDINLRVI